MRGTCAVGALIVAALASSSTTASAASVIRAAAGANAAAIQTAVDQFRVDVGAPNNGVGGSALSGRREINWDGVPDNFSEPNAFPFDFFNVNSPRGVVFESVGNIGGQHSFRVSASAASGTAVRFGNIEPTYTTTFQTFSAEKLFAAKFANTIDVLFFVPGTKIPATVSGFGAVFADVDTSSTDIEYYGADGKKLSGSSLNVANNGLSFLGTSFNAGERVARVQMTLGKNQLQAGNVDGTNGVDVVALDDFIYGEPEADPSAIRFADAKLVGGEGSTATVSVVRAGRGPASVDVKVTGGSATSGRDFTFGTTKTVTFGLDETVKTVSVPLASDDAIEGDETVQLSLSNPTGGSVVDPVDTTLTILDRTPAPPVTVTTPTPIPPAPTSVERDRTPPTLTLGSVRKTTTRAAFLRGVDVTITPNEPSKLTVDLLGTTARATLARTGDLVLASRTLPLASGPRTLRLRPSRKLLTHAHRRFTARLRITATDAFGNATTLTRSITVR